MQYKNLVFDIGWVMLSYRWRKPMMDMGLPEEEARMAVHTLVESPFWPLLDYGVLTMDEISEKAAHIWPEYGPYIKGMFDHIDEIAITRPGIYERVRKLKEMGYKIYFLSNYSEQMLKIHNDLAHFLEMGDGALISYEVGMIKPEKRIYETLLSRYDLKAEECVFFDDREDNCQGAEGCGIHTIQVLSEEMLAETLDRVIRGEEI